MGEKSVLSEMILPVVEVIITLLGFVCEVKFGELSESTEAKHSKGTGQTSHSATATLHCALEQLAVDVLHVLEHSDKLMFGCCTGDDSCLRKHIPAASRLQFHLVHEVLYAVPIKDAIAVNKQHEEVVVSAEIVLVYSIDEAECLLLTASLAAMREARNSDSAATVSDINTPGKGLQRDGNTELLNGPQVQFVLILAIKRQENMKAAWWILAVGD